MSESRAYPCPVRSSPHALVLDTGRLFAAVYEDWLKRIPEGAISRRFHLGLCLGIAEWVHRAAQELDVHVAALSGGVFQNRTMAVGLPERLRSLGVAPLIHTALPPNDACISFGQAAYARIELAGP